MGHRSAIEIEDKAAPAVAPPVAGARDMAHEIVARILQLKPGETLRIDVAALQMLYGDCTIDMRVPPFPCMIWNDDETKEWCCRRDSDGEH